MAVSKKLKIIDDKKFQETIKNICRYPADTSKLLGYTVRTIYNWHNGILPSSNAIQRMLEVYPLKPEDIGAGYVKTKRKLKQNKKMAKILKELLLFNGLSQTDFADILGFNRKTVNGWCTRYLHSIYK